MGAIEQIDIELSDGAEVKAAVILFQKMKLDFLGLHHLDIREEFRSWATKLRPVVNTERIPAISMQGCGRRRTGPRAYLQVARIWVSIHEVVNERPVLLTRHPLNVADPSRKRATTLLGRLEAALQGNARRRRSEVSMELDRR